MHSPWRNYRSCGCRSWIIRDRPPVTQPEAKSAVAESRPDSNVLAHASRPLGPRSMAMQVNSTSALKRVPWNKGKLTGAKPPLRPKHVWSIRTKLQIDIATDTATCAGLRLTATAGKSPANTGRHRASTSRTTSILLPPSPFTKSSSARGVRTGIRSGVTIDQLALSSATRSGSRRFLGGGRAASGAFCLYGFLGCGRTGRGGAARGGTPRLLRERRARRRAARFALEDP